MAKKRTDQPIDAKSEAFLQMVDSMRNIANDLEEQLGRRPAMSPATESDHDFKEMIERIESWMDEAATFYNATVEVITKGMPRKKLVGAFVPKLMERLRLPRGSLPVIESSSLEPRPPWDVGLLSSMPEMPMRLGELPTHIVDAGGTSDALVASYNPSLKNWAELGVAVHESMDWKCARTSELCKWLRESATGLELAALPRLEVGQSDSHKFEVVVHTPAGKITRRVNFAPMEWVWKLKRLDEIDDDRAKKFKHQLGRELPEIYPFINPVTTKRRSGAAAYKSKPYRLDDRIKRRLVFNPTAEKELARNRTETPHLPPKAQNPASAAKSQVPENPTGRDS